MVNIYAPIRRPADSIFEKIWEKAVRLSIHAAFLIDSNNAPGTIYESFWSASPAGNRHLFVITDRIPNKSSFKGGMNYNVLFSIVMRKYENDSGLLVHEMTHADQAYRDGILGHFYDVAFVPRRRYELELEGYAVSIAFGMSPDTAASLLLTPGYYNLTSLGLTKEAIINDLNR